LNEKLKGLVILPSTPELTQEGKSEMIDFDGFMEILSVKPAKKEEKKSDFVTRTVKQKVLSVEQSEGVGARVRRSIGGSKLRNFDPFLMLDEFKVGKPAGFPDHPHRGFETVTYMLPETKGVFCHEDFEGHKGTIRGGDLQWMTAGKGIVHSEMPGNDEISHGLQLWVNLSKKDKMTKPSYQELKREDIPITTKDGVTAIVIAGEALGIKSKVYTRTPTYYLHFKMKPDSSLSQPIPTGWNSFVYVVGGEANFGGTTSDAHHTLALSMEGDGLTVKTGTKSVDFVLLAGKPTGEPIVQHGPFVMNTQAEIYQAMHDYQGGKNGFEKAPGWYSQIGLPITHADERGAYLDDD